MLKALQQPNMRHLLIPIEAVPEENRLTPASVAAVTELEKDNQV